VRVLLKWRDWDDEMRIMEDPFGEPGTDKDVWAHATGWDERDLAQPAEAEDRGPSGEISPELTRGAAPSGMRRETAHPLDVASGVGGVAVVLAMILKLYLIGWLVNTDLSAAHAGVWTYMCAYGVVGVFVGLAMRWTSWTFGLSQVLYPELYGQVGFWLFRLGIAVASVGYLGYLITHYLF
jgi:hypothetical protein